jgi:hypothetical protein
MCIHTLKHLIYAYERLLNTILHAKTTILHAYIYIYIYIYIVVPVAVNQQNFRHHSRGYILAPFNLDLNSARLVLELFQTRAADASRSTYIRTY